jgi:hypothetical protein
MEDRERQGFWRRSLAVLPAIGAGLLPRVT